MSITVVKQLQKLDLPATEKNVAIAFALHLWENDPSKGAWVGRPKLAAETGFSESAVDKAMAGLRQKQVLIGRGHKTGVKAKMPIYTVHPENWHQSAFWASGEPVREATSSPQDSVPRTPSNGVGGLDGVNPGLDSVKPGQDSVPQEEDSVPQAPDKDLASYIEKEGKSDFSNNHTKPNGQDKNYSSFGEYAAEVEQIDHDLAIAHQGRLALSAKREPTPNRSAAVTKKLAIQIITLSGQRGGGSFSVNSRQSLIEEIMENQGFSDAEWKEAAGMVLEDLAGSDDGGFHLGHAGTKVPGTIVSKLPAAVRRCAEKAMQPFLIQICTLQGRRDVIVGSIESDRARAEEAALVEESLGGLCDGLPV